MKTQLATMERFDEIRDYRDHGRNVRDLVHGYLVCAIWSSTAEDGSELTKDFCITAISDLSFADAVAECEKFIQVALATRVADSNLWDALLKHSPTNEEASAAEHIGHNIWLTRNGHGTGFWDRNYLPKKVWEAATHICEMMGTVDLYVGDDERLWFA